MTAQKFHDALILKQPELVRFPNDGQGNFTVDSEEVSPGQDGYRKVVNLVESDDDYMSVATLPLRDEPEASNFCCYVINAPRVGFPNSWCPGARSEAFTIVSNERAFRFKVNGPGPAQYSRPVELAGSELAQLEATLGNQAGYTTAIGLVSTKNGDATHGYIINTPEVDFSNPWTSSKLFDGQADTAPKSVTSLNLLLGCADGTIRRVVWTKGNGASISTVQHSAAQAALKAGVALGGVKEESTTVQLINLECFGATTGVPSLLLLATRDGDVLQLQITNGGAQATVTTLASKSGFADTSYAQIWHLLRNGCIAGTVKLPAPVPLINLSAFVDIKPSSTAEPPKKPDFKGTLDFKWKAGKTLVVAIDKPVDMPTARFAQVRDTIVETARQWTATGAKIALHFIDAPSDPRVKYDIWVDLNVIPKKYTTEQVPTPGYYNVRLTSSTLGRYAQRLPFGEPTMYLGRIEGIETSLGATEYWDSPAFRHAILHEFGHALGLPHLHQYTVLRDRIAQDRATSSRAVFISDSNELRNRVGGAMGLNLTNETINDELLGELEDVAQFSEWPKLPDADPASTKRLSVRVAEESVMFGLPVLNILEDAKGSATKATYKTALGPIDKDWIKQLYP